MIEEIVVVDVLGVLSTSIRETIVEKIIWGDLIIITVSL